jgi:hypothetical protein
MDVITDESIFVHNCMVHKKKTKEGVILFIDSTKNEQRKSKVPRSI